MLKISQKSSTVISLVLCWTALGLIVAAAVLLPSVLSALMRIFEKPAEHYAPVLTLLYVALLPALVADGALLQLLSLVRRDEVFCSVSIACLRALSWCCFAEAVLFAVLGYYFITSLIVAAAAAFLGVVLRVVKNVIAQAAEIKAENDYTV